jgi:hypothetical protein
MNFCVLKGEIKAFPTINFLNFCSFQMDFELDGKTDEK